MTDRQELERCARRLDRLGVRYSPPAPAHSVPGATVLVLRDPDNIQLELFAEPDVHPADRTE